MPARTIIFSPTTGYINLTFVPGLPAGIYTFVAHTTELQYPGITDAAGNPIDDTVTSARAGHQRFRHQFRHLSPSPCTSRAWRSRAPTHGDGSTVIGTEQSYFELPPPRPEPTRVTTCPRLPRPSSSTSPTRCRISIASGVADQLRQRHPAHRIGQRHGTAIRRRFRQPGRRRAGEHGQRLHDRHRHDGHSLQLRSSDLDLGTDRPRRVGHAAGADSSADTLPPTITASTSPTRSTPGNVNTEIFDIYGNQLDGENLGNQTSQASPDFNNPDAPASVPDYEDLQTNGTYRMDDMSGDGVAGGAFMAGFTVVNYGNVVFAQPGYVENPLVPSTLLQRQPGQSLPGAGPRGRSQHGSPPTPITIPTAA